MATGLVFSVGLVVITIVFLVTFRGRTAKAMATADDNAPQFRLGAMAQQMGLTVLEGDPQTSLVYALGVHRMQRIPASTTFGSHTTTTRLRMAGSPAGRPTDFVLFCETVSEWVGGYKLSNRMEHRTTFDCCLSVQLPVAVPPFEVVLRHEISGLETQPRLGLPAQSFGAPELDARLVLTAGDPRLGPVLAPMAVGMTSFHSLHILGQGAALFWLTSENASSTALYQLVDAQWILYALADVLTGAAPAPGYPAPYPAGGQTHWS